MFLDTVVYKGTRFNKKVILDVKTTGTFQHTFCPWSPTDLSKEATVLLACAAGAIVYCVIKVLAVSQRFGHPRVLGIPMIASTLPKLFQTGEKLGLSITNLQLNSVDAC